MSATTQSTTSQRPPVVAVFCASSPGTNPIHLAAGRDLAHALHSANASLVYGGGSKGIMGAIAQTLVSLAGRRSVHGVIPRALVQGDERLTKRVGEGEGEGKEAERVLTAEEREKVAAGTGMGMGTTEGTEFGTMTVVEDMHTRKKMMADLVMAGGPGSGFVGMTGGYGTLEEVMEMVTWNQLGIHQMPIVLLNIDGYWDGLIQWIRGAVEGGYVKEDSRDILIEVKRPEEVVDALRNYQLASGRFDLQWGPS